MEKAVFQKKYLPVLAFLLAAAAVIGVPIQWRARRQREQAAEDARRTETLVQAAEALLTEQGPLLDRLAEVLTREERPLYIAWEQDPWEAEGAFLVNGAGSPEDLEPGFTQEIEALFALLPGDSRWHSISYRGADSALISIDYDEVRTDCTEDSAILFGVSLDYDGAVWSVGTETYGLV